MMTRIEIETFGDIILPLKVLLFRLVLWFP